MTHYALFESLAESYPAGSLWIIGRSEVMEWSDICQHAIDGAQHASGGDVTGSPESQARYWRSAYTVLEAASEIMVSCEMVTTTQMEDES